MAPQQPPPPSSQPRPPPPTAYRRRQSYNEFEELEPSEDSDHEDLFFTPNTSPRTSMASSFLMFPTGRKPSRRSLRLSGSSDIVILADVASATVAAARGPSPTSTRAPFSSTQNRQLHPRHIHTLSSASSSTNSVEPRSSVLSTGSVEPANTTSPAVSIPTAESDDKKYGKVGTTKRTRHGLVTIKPNPDTTTTESVKSTTTTTTTSKRKSSQQGLADGDVTKDVKRSTPLSSSPPPVIAAAKRKSTQQGLGDGDLTKDGRRSMSSAAPGSATSNGSAVTVKNTTTASTVGQPYDPTSRKSPKPPTSANLGPAASSKEMKQDVVVVETERGKQVDSSSPLSSSKLRKDKGKEKEKTNTTTPAQTNPIPKPIPHTFSAFAPLPATTTPSLIPPANGNANDSINNNNNRSSLPPAGFSFPPPPSHSPQQQQQRRSQSQQPKNSLNGSAAAYTYALRQKGNSSPKPSGSGGGIWPNMTALLEEDEVDEGNGSTPTRRLRRIPNGGNGQGKGKEKKRISGSTTSSRSDSSSHYSYPSQSNANSYPTTSNSNTTGLSQSQQSQWLQSQQSQWHSDSSTFRGPPKTLTSEVNAMTVSTPGELPSKGTQGYNSLVLPRAPPPHSGSLRSSTTGSGSRKWFKNVGKEGRVDLTRSGVAQTTMASVEVIRGLGRQQGQKLGGKLMGILRKRSTSGGSAGRPRPIEGLGKPVDDTKENFPTKVKAPTTAGVEGTILGFTSHRKPPGFVPSGSVLVQVWAVGVDGVDGRLVGVNFGDQVWRERGVGGYEDDETGVETEWEREVQKGEASEEVSRSTPQQGSGFSGLGRSFSLRMSRTKKRGSIGSGQQDNNQQDRGRRTSITTEKKPSRSFSLKRNNNIVQPSPPQPAPPQQNTLTKSSSQRLAQRHKMLQKATHRADVGYIPGRSFVGRVLECGWDVRDEEVRKGEWVVGLLDIKKVSFFLFFWGLFGVGFFCVKGVRRRREASKQGGEYIQKWVLPWTFFLTLIAVIT